MHFLHHDQQLSYGSIFPLYLVSIYNYAFCLARAELECIAKQKY